MSTAGQKKAYELGMAMGCSALNVLFEIFDDTGSAVLVPYCDFDLDAPAPSIKASG